METGLVAEKVAEATAEVSRGSGTTVVATTNKPIYREGKTASWLTAEATAEQFNNSQSRKEDSKSREIARGWRAAAWKKIKGCKEPEKRNFRPRSLKSSRELLIKPLEPRV